jgi:hypothetical protein
MSSCLYKQRKKGGKGRKGRPARIKIRPKAKAAALSEEVSRLQCRLRRFRLSMS